VPAPVAAPAPAPEPMAPADAAAQLLKHGFSHAAGDYVTFRAEVIADVLANIEKMRPV